MKGIHYWLIGLCVLALVQTAMVAVNYAQEGTPRSSSEEEEFYYGDPDVRNPFIPLFVPTPTPTVTPTPTPKSTGERRPTARPTPISAPDLRLDGVFWSSKSPLAIINDQMMHTGDWIAGARLVQIDRDVVYLDFQGYSLKLELQEDYTISIE